MILLRFCCYIFVRHQQKFSYRVYYKPTRTVLSKCFCNYFLQTVFIGCFFYGFSEKNVDLAKLLPISVVFQSTSSFALFHRSLHLGFQIQFPFHFAYGFSIGAEILEILFVFYFCGGLGSFSNLYLGKLFGIFICKKTSFGKTIVQHGCCIFKTDFVIRSRHNHGNQSNIISGRYSRYAVLCQTGTSCF